MTYQFDVKRALEEFITFACWVDEDSICEGRDPHFDDLRKIRDLLDDVIVAAGGERCQCATYSSQPPDAQSATKSVPNSWPEPESPG